MPEKSNHKKAWQTAQQALQIARDTQSAARALVPPPPGKWQRVLSLTKWLLGTLVVGSLGFLATVYQLTGGPPWPTSPDFNPPKQSSVGSPFDTAFDVTNKSGLADLYDLSIKCQMVYLKSERLTVTKDFRGQLIFNARQTNPVLSAGSTNQFTCPFREHLNEWGLGASALNNPSEARIGLIATYRSPAWWPGSWFAPFQTAPATMFTLDINNSPSRWTIPLK